METYKNLSGSSGVAAFDFGTDYIRVRFTTGAIYIYSHSSAGMRHIEQMKILAKAGSGLNAYINVHVRKLYSKKEY
jgi:hypothetical protein